MHVLHREAEVDQVAVDGDVHGLEVVRAACAPSYHGMSRARLDHVVAVERRERDEVDVARSRASRRTPRTRRDAVEDLLGVARRGPSC